MNAWRLVTTQIQTNPGAWTSDTQAYIQVSKVGFKNIFYALKTFSPVTMYSLSGVLFLAFGLWITLSIYLFQLYSFHDWKKKFSLIIVSFK